MKNARNHTVQQQADTTKSSGGNQGTATKSPLLAALETIKVEIARLSTDIALEQNAAKKAMLVEELTSIMASIGMSYDGAYDEPIDASPKEAPADEATDTKKPNVFKRATTWVKANKAKTAAIAVAIIATAAAVAYALRSGNTEKAAEAVDTVVQKMSEAASDMVGESTTEPSVIAKAGEVVADGWNHVVEYAVKGKDVVVGLFTKVSVTEDTVQAGFHANA